MIRRILFIINILSIAIALPASAIAGVTPVLNPNGYSEFTISFENSTIEYEIENGDLEFERDIITLALASGGNSGNVFGSIGLINDSDIEDSSNYDLDNGYIFMFGGRGYIYDMSPVKVSFFAQVEYLMEKFSSDLPGWDREIEIENYIEVDLGFSAIYALSDTLSGFAAITLTPYTEGQVKADGNGFSGDADIEKDSLFGFKIGLAGHFDQWLFGADLSFGSESSLNIHTGIAF